MTRNITPKAIGSMDSGNGKETGTYDSGNGKDTGT